MTNATEGITKPLRQLLFSSKEDVNEMEIPAYIEEAIGNEIAEKAIKPTKKKEVLSSKLQQRLDNSNTLAKAFQKFSLANKENSTNTLKK